MTPRPPFHWSNRPIPEATKAWLYGVLFGSGITITLAVALYIKYII